VFRALRKYRIHGKGDIAKLFARHFKLSEHLEYVKKTRISIAVGTPGRLKALVESEEGQLRLNKLKYLVIDANYVDGKKRTIFDIPETVKDLFQIIVHGDIRKRIAKCKLRVVFY
jgi:protein CMS1